MLSGLTSKEAEERLKTLRSIKHAVIGNKAKKAHFIKEGAVKLVLALLLEGSDVEEQVHCAATLGSLACNSDGATQLRDNGGVDGLVAMLSSPDAKVMEACMRALKLIYTQVGRVADGIVSRERGMKRSLPPFRMYVSCLPAGRRPRPDLCDPAASRPPGVAAARPCLAARHGGGLALYPVPLLRHGRGARRAHRLWRRRGLFAGESRGTPVDR